MDNSDVAAVAALAVTASVGLVGQMLPPLPQVRRASDPDTAADVHTGLAAVAALTIGIGGVLAALLRSHLPLLLAGLIAAGLAIVYERALRMRGAAR